MICFAPSPRSRRQNFTLVHELGHFLVNEDDDVLNWLADRSNPAMDVERLCDTVAAQILLPESMVLRVLGEYDPAPEHLRQLYAASRASEEVCAIALAQRLRGRGAVVLIRRRTAAVMFAAGSGWPPLVVPRGLAVPQHHPLRELGIRQRWSGWTTQDLRLATSETLPDRPMPNLLFTLAEAGPKRTTAILLDSQSADARGSAKSTRAVQIGSRYGEITICPNCGRESISDAYPCEDCGAPPCGECGRCRCM